MKLNNISDPEFIGHGISILKKNRELLVLIRYPFGNKDFCLLSSKKDFLTLLRGRARRESITLFKNVKIMFQDTVNNDFTDKVLQKASHLSHISWLSIEKETGNWCFVGDIEELEEELEDTVGKEITILIEPDWFNEELVFHAYVPDDDGVIRLGSY